MSLTQVTGVPSSTNFSSNGKLIFYLPFDGSSNVDSVGGLIPVNPGQVFVIMRDVSTTPLTVTLTGTNITQTGNPLISVGSDFSLNFPGTVGNYITFADARFSASSWATIGFTLEAWVNYTSFTNVGGGFPVSFGTMSPTNSGITGPNWSFGVNTSGMLVFYYYTTTAQTVTASSGTLSVNTFYHICVQCDTTNIYLYVNGVRVANQAVVPTPQLTNGINFTIGQHLGNAGPNFYVGDLRLVYGAAVYSVTGFTKPTTLLQNYTAGGATTALNLRNPNESNIQNPTFNTVNPKIGTASMFFNNVIPSAFANSFILYNQSIDICVSGYTIALWANVYTLPSGVTQFIMSTRGNTQYQGQIRCYTYGTTPSVTYWNKGNGASASCDFAAIAPNTWHHFAVTIKPNGDISFYLDGTEGQAGQNCQPTAYTANGGYMYGLFLGSSAVNPPYFNAMNGEIDDVRVYNFALSKSQITDIYNTNFTTLKNPISATLTGTPILSQLSVAPVGAFSLRAVGGVTAKAVNVVRYPVVQWPPVAMTSNATVVSSQAYGNGTYTANASISYNSTWVIFDNNIYTYYENATAFPYNLGTGTYIGSNATTISSVSVPGEWFQLELPTSIILRSYTLVGRQDNAWWGDRNPTTFWIAGSNNLGGPWSNVDQQTNITPPQEGITINVPSTSNSLPYTYYRLVVNVIGNSNTGVIYRNLVNLASWNLFGDSPSYTTGSSDFYADRLGNLLTAPVTGIDLTSWLSGATGYVSTWYDQSGNGNNFNQSTQANRPQILKATKGSGYSLLCDGTSSYLTTPSSGFLDNTDYTIVSVTRRNAAKRSAYFFGTDGSGTDHRLHFGYEYSKALGDGSDSYKLDQYADGVSYSSLPIFTTAAVEPVRYITGMQSATSGKKLYSSDIANYGVAATSASTTPLSSTGIMRIGNANAGYYQGEIFEILVFKRSLYDVDTSGSLIAQIYNNQVGYTGL